MSSTCSQNTYLLNSIIVVLKVNIHARCYLGEPGDKAIGVGLLTLMLCF